jgi:hypothetical protein
MKNKLPKSLLDAMKNAKEVSNVNEFDNSFTKTDFTPKKKVSNKEKIKKSIAKFFSNIKNAKLVVNIKSWFYNKFIKPNKEKKKKKEYDDYVKELKSNFSKKFNVNVEKTIEIMSQPGYSPYVVDNDRLLIENRLDINKRKSLYKFAPFVYEPKIVDVHNENLNSNNPTIDEIKSNDSNKANDDLNKQLNFYKKRPHLTVGGRKSDRLF